MDRDDCDLNLGVFLGREYQKRGDRVLLAPMVLDVPGGRQPIGETGAVILQHGDNVSDGRPDIHRRSVGPSAGPAFANDTCHMPSDDGWVTTKARRLAERASERLRSQGGAVEPGFFVCPTCLQLLPIERANESHYPARSAPALRRQTEVQCDSCNNRVGALYEKGAAEFLTHVRTVTMGSLDGTGPKLIRPATLRRDADGVKIMMKSKHLHGPRDHPAGVRAQFERAAPQTGAPRTIGVTIAKPAEDVAKRALLAWSFLHFFYYAGYRYAATPGAMLARRLILHPERRFPEGAFFQKGEAEMPLAAPEPGLVVRVGEGEALEETVGPCVTWGPLVIVLPFANDQNERAWRRVSQLLVIDQLRSVRVAQLRTFGAATAHALDVSFVAVDDGVKRTVTMDLPEIQLKALAMGVSPWRLDPRKPITWRASMQVEHQFSVVEDNSVGWPEGWEPPPGKAARPVPRGTRVGPRSRPPRPEGINEDRVRYWRGRHIGLGGGWVPQQVATMLADMPGAPQPIPDVAPLRMEKAPEGWIASLAMEPSDLRAFDPEPMVAVARLMAVAEQAFAPTSDPD